MTTGNDNVHSSSVWNHNDLQQYLTENAIPAEIMLLTVDTPTVPAAAEAIGVTVDQIAKTVIFFVDNLPYAVIANGIRRVDSRKLAVYFGVNRKKVKLADSDSVLTLTGYAPGSVPPFGHRTPIPILMSPTIREQEIIYAGGGGIHALVKITSADLIRVSRAKMVDVLEEKSNNATD